MSLRATEVFNALLSDVSECVPSVVPRMFPLVELVPLVLDRISTLVIVPNTMEEFLGNLVQSSLVFVIEFMRLVGWGNLLFDF